MVFFVPIQSHQTPQKIGVFPSKGGFYYLWYTKLVLCWKHYFYSVFSKTQLCRHERVQLEKKQKFTKNSGLFAKMQKGVFFWSVFFWWFCFLFACVFVLLFCKRHVLKCLFSSFSVFFPCSPFVFPFKIPYLLCFLSINPFLEKILCGGFFCLSFLFVFSVLNICFFLWNKLPKLHFLKPKLLWFLAFLHGVCFCLSVLMLALFLLCSECVLILCLLCFLVLLSDYEKNIVFLCNSSVLSCWF